MLKDLKELCDKRKNGSVSSSEFGSLIIGLCIKELMNGSYNREILSKIIDLASDIEIEERDKEYRANKNLTREQIEVDLILFIEKLKNIKNNMILI